MVYAHTHDGRTVQKIQIANDQLSAEVLNYGGILHSVQLAGMGHNLTVAPKTFAPYEMGMQYFGAIIGPVVNRISSGRATIRNERFEFERNQDGRHTLHSGSSGTHKKIWGVLKTSKKSVVLGLTLPHGEGGFPGRRRIEAKYEIIAQAKLKLSLTATTDRPTLINLAAHPYWNLDGTRNISGHTLSVDAKYKLETNSEGIPTGKRIKVKGSDLDVLSSAALLDGRAPFADHCFILANARRALAPVAVLRGKNNVSMIVSTTEPGIQIYDGRDTDMCGPEMAPFAGLAMEAQGWPDAPNQSEFPSITLDKRQMYKQVTVWDFHKT